MACSASFLHRSIARVASTTLSSSLLASTTFAVSGRAFSTNLFPRNSTCCGCGCGGLQNSCTRRGGVVRSSPLLFASSGRHYCTEKKESDSTANATTAKDGDKPTEPATPEDELKQMKSQLLYALADAENARRIAAEDIKKARDFSVKDFAKDMCDVMDALDRATLELNKLSGDDKVRLKPITQGIELTRNILVHNLERHGVRKIKSDIGSVFDCNVHEALFNHTIKEDEKLEPGQIAAVVKTGYMIHQRVLRAAQVGVAQKADL